MQPNSLFYLCLEIASQMDPSTYDGLPVTVKELLLGKVTRRGCCTNLSLMMLTHPNLKKLDLRYCKITEWGLLCLRKLVKLKCLYLPQPPYVTPEFFSEGALIKVLRNKPELRILGMSGLHGVNDRVVGVLVGGSPELVELHLDSTAISNQAFFCLGNLASLQCLNIAKTNVNDSGFKQLALGSAGQSLVELRLDGCFLLTQQSLRTMSRTMTRLKYLYLNLCPDLSPHALEDNLWSENIKQLSWTIYD